MLIVALAVACGDSSAGGPDGGVDGGPDDPFGLRDAATGSSTVGQACDRDSDCAAGLSCDVEIDQSFSASRLPAGVSQVQSAVFPGGSCTPIPATVPDGTTEVCYPFGPPNLSGCGEGGACSFVTVADTTSLTRLAACRAQCTPTADGSGCDRFGYTCHTDLGVCVEGCQSDEECRVRVVDADGDGVDDSLEYDDESRAICDVEGFRCVHDRTNNAQTGDACERLDDCERDGLCRDALVGMDFPGGFCSKIGCEVEGRECRGDNAVCESLRGETSISYPTCLTRCTVGAERAALRVGADGHGEGCREGYRCHYNGGEGAESGVCVGGNYNDVSESNVGAACTSDAECYSPYGYGRCEDLSGTGLTSVCTIVDCAAPGLPDDICGPSGLCYGFGSDFSLCVQECSDAKECAEGYACADDDGVASTERICFPVCFEDADCRKNSERCVITRAEMTAAAQQGRDAFGECVPN